MAEDSLVGEFTGHMSFLLLSNSSTCGHHWTK